MILAARTALSVGTQHFGFVVMIASHNIGIPPIFGFVVQPDDEQVLCHPRRKTIFLIAGIPNAQ